MTVCDVLNDVDIHIYLLMHLVSQYSSNFEILQISRVKGIRCLEAVE